ncbi:MAG: hypothetical protein FJY74_07585 [Candidatus Eisenbacteria bacterium]|nr:hypothetical protein [Candidatus Eisenbacteria bacterium]
MRRSVRYLGVWTGIAALATIAVSAVVGVSDTPVYVEGEDFVSYAWHNLGGADIRIEWCSGASQGYAAGGLDVPGEWIMLKVDFLRSGCYEPHVIYQAGYGDTVSFNVKVLDESAPGGSVTSAFTATGWGFG